MQASQEGWKRVRANPGEGAIGGRQGTLLQRGDAPAQEKGAPPGLGGPQLSVEVLREVAWGNVV